jgi:hypothetical protein
MYGVTDRVKGFYAKTNKPARLNIFVGRAFFSGGPLFALCACVTTIHANPLPIIKK